MEEISRSGGTMAVILCINQCSPGGEEGSHRSLCNCGLRVSVDESQHMGQLYYNVKGGFPLSGHS